MVMSNYHESEPRLRAFLDVGREELMMTHGDPAAATPISTIGKLFACHRSGCNVIDK